MEFDNTAADGEAQSSAAPASRNRRIELLKLLEDALPVGRSDARPRVTNLYLEPVAPLLCRHLDGANVGEFDSVSDKVRSTWRIRRSSPVAGANAPVMVTDNRRFLA